MKKILFTGGGTGGHIMPILAIGQALKEIAPEIELHYMGPKSNLSRSLEKEGFRVHFIVSGKIRRYLSLKNLLDVFFNIPFSFIQSFFLLLLIIRPALVFSKGGTGSLPVAYCAKVLKIPVFIHESDTVPGLSNKIAGKWAQIAFTSFEKTEYLPKDKIKLVGNPIRKELLQGYMQDSVKTFNLLSDKPVILILGGSQGSEPINEFIVFILEKLLKNYEVIHVTGPNNYKKSLIRSKGVIKNKSLESRYHLYEFLNQVQLKDAYYIADAIVSRSGSGSIFEIAAAGKPSILIPLPGSAHNHQVKNAYLYQKSGATVVIEQENLSYGFFVAELESILQRHENMGKAALNFSRLDAAEKIAHEIVDFYEKKSAKNK